MQYNTLECSYCSASSPLLQNASTSFIKRLLLPRQTKLEYAVKLKYKYRAHASLRLRMRIGFEFAEDEAFTEGEVLQNLAGCAQALT